MDEDSPAFEHHSTLGIKASIRFKFRYWQVRKEALLSTTAASIKFQSLVSDTYFEP